MASDDEKGKEELFRLFPVPEGEPEPGSVRPCCFGDWTRLAPQSDPPVALHLRFCPSPARPFHLDSLQVSFCLPHLSEVE